MKKLYIVKTNEDFSKIISTQNFVKNQSFIIYKKNNNLPYDRFGISVRKIRSIIDNYKKSYNNSQDYIIIFRKGGENRTFQELQQDFLTLMKQKRKDNNYAEKKK